MIAKCMIYDISSFEFKYKIPIKNVIVEMMGKSYLSSSSVFNRVRFTQCLIFGSDVFCRSLFVFDLIILSFFYYVYWPSYCLSSSIYGFLIPFGIFRAFIKCCVFSRFVSPVILQLITI